MPTQLEFKHSLLQFLELCSQFLHLQFSRHLFEFDSNILHVFLDVILLLYYREGILSVAL